MGLPANDRRSPSPLESDRSGIQALNNLLVGPSDPYESLLPAADETYPAALLFVPRWSRHWLVQAISHFENPKAEWCICAWLECDPSMPATTLLMKAIHSHIPFHLEVPAAVIPRWRRDVKTYSVWEVQAGEYYRGTSQARPIIYNTVGSEYSRAYQLSVLEALNCPNSTVFFFEGGLLARLVLHYGNPGLLSQAMEGLSAVMTLHGTGYTDYSRDTRREQITDPKKNVLLGQSSTGAPRPKFITYGLQSSSFRPVSNLTTGNGPLTVKIGSWNAKTEGGWMNHFRHGRGSHIKDSQWNTIEDVITRNSGASWEGSALRDKRNLEDPVNDYKEP